MVNGFSNRGTWSNGNRSAMVALSRIYDDPALLSKVTEEREHALSMLLARGKAFMEAAKSVNLPTCPYDSGFCYRQLRESRCCERRALQGWDFYRTIQQ